MLKRHLIIQQLDAKLVQLAPLQRWPAPPVGWIRTIRMALGMSLEQLGKKLSITKQSAGEIEARETEGSVTLRSLREAANALDMQLVYGFVPNDGSLESLIERKAAELAERIVMRTSQTMKLEDQENSDERIHKAIQEKTQAIKNEIPGMLWD